MFSHHIGGIAKLDVVLSTNGEILLLAVDAGGTVQLLQTKNGEANQDGSTLCAAAHVGIESRSVHYAKVGFDHGYINAVEQDIRSIHGKQSWTAWKIDLESREKRKDFEREIDDVEKYLISVNEEIATLMRSNSSLPGEKKKRNRVDPFCKVKTYVGFRYIGYDKMLKCDYFNEHLSCR